MKLKSTWLYLSLGFLLWVGCSGNTEIDETIEFSETKTETNKDQEETGTASNADEKKTLRLLSLGDSYTIGESVCDTCKFPVQLKTELKSEFDTNVEFELQVIAQTGWTTSALISAINVEKPKDNFDLVTLLIGVNNQFQARPFSLYENEFIRLVNTATRLANSKKDKVIVVSIPDYAFTPFGKGNINISNGIDRYNNFAKNYCASISVSYVNITDITRDGLNNTALVASDGLHPSELAYSKFVERILPIALEKLKS